MKTWCIICLALWALVLFTGCSREDAPSLGPNPPDSRHAQYTNGPASKPRQGSLIDYKISGPYVHNNLALYLFHGEEKLPGSSFLTLQEALDQKKVVVHETDNVSELCIENLSENEDVFIQAGEIVKGGKQDRVLACSTIVPPKSGKLPIGSYCVEQGRWRSRGSEAVTNFSNSNNLVSSNELKIAVLHSSSQQQVWQEVGDMQKSLNSRLDTNVCSSVSPTSLELALDNDLVKEAVKEYEDKLSSIFVQHDDLIGFAFAINGKINAADIYTSRALFRKLWPKLFRACSVEAVAKMEKRKSVEVPSIEKLENWLAETRSVKAQPKDVNSRVQMRYRETDSNIVFETIDKELNQSLLHLGYISK
jgi:hypothetical protein